MREVQRGTSATPSWAATRLTIVCFSSSLLRRGASGPLGGADAHSRALAAQARRLGRRRPQSLPQPSHGGNPMREYSIAAIPADGIGPEVIAAGVTVLRSLEQRL